VYVDQVHAEGAHKAKGKVAELTVNIKMRLLKNAFMEGKIDRAREFEATNQPSRF
jgi:hypothetical protein